MTNFETLHAENPTLAKSKILRALRPSGLRGISALKRIRAEADRLLEAIGAETNGDEWETVTADLLHAILEGKEVILNSTDFKQRYDKELAGFIGFLRQKFDSKMVEQNNLPKLPTGEYILINNYELRITTINNDILVIFQKAAPAIKQLFEEKNKK